MIFIKEDLKVNDTQISVLAGILNVWVLVGSLAAGRTSDFLGRRYTIVLASIMFLVCSVLMGYAPNYPILNMEAKENTTFREEEEFSKNMFSKALFENNFQKQEPNNGPLFDISIQTHKTLKEDGEHLWFHFQFFFCS